jgi:predicted RNase H-like HicB family nuclease
MPDKLPLSITPGKAIDAAPSTSPPRFCGDITFFSPAGRIIIASMKQFTAIIHHGEPAEGGFWATCLEIPGANCQGETKEQCLENLKQAIRLLLDTQREEIFRLDPHAETTDVILT